MKKRLYALLLATMTALGMLLAAPVSAHASPAPPSQPGVFHVDNTITNTLLSNANLPLVCGGPSGCVSLMPGWQAHSSGNYTNPVQPTWNPTQVWIGPYQSALYRVVKGEYLGPWGGIQGGVSGQWLDVGTLLNFFSCAPGNYRTNCDLQIISNDPR